jgi:chromosome condensin MukBEF MukE localization factor
VTNLNQDLTLGKAIANALFPIADYKLRRGVHLSIEDVELYDFVKLNFSELAPFYRRYEAELLEGAEGYFYLVSQGAIFGQRQLSKGEMLVALTIAHLFRDPEHRVRGTGEISADHVISHLEALKTMEDIARVMTETRVKADLHPARMREAVLDAIKKLAALNFLHLLDSTGARFRCKRPIHRFDQFVAQIDPVTVPVEAEANHENE